MSNPTKSIHVSTKHVGYRISGTVVFGDFEGSADVEHGRNWLPPYVQDDFMVIDFMVFDASGHMHDATEDIDESARDDMKEELITLAAAKLEARND